MVKFPHYQSCRGVISTVMGFIKNKKRHILKLKEGVTEPIQQNLGSRDNDVDISERIVPYLLGPPKINVVMS